MNINELRCGDIIKHFKREEDSREANYLYVFVGLSKHTETGEDLVVYTAMYGNKQLYVRPLSMFCEKVDKDKYPNIKQEYRFEKIECKRMIKINDKFRELNPSEILQAVLNRNDDWSNSTVVYLRDHEITDLSEVTFIESISDNKPPKTVFYSPVKCRCGENRCIYLQDGQISGIELVDVLPKGNIFKTSKYTYKCHTCGEYIEK